MSANQLEQNPLCNKTVSKIFLDLPIQTRKEISDILKNFAHKAVSPEQNLDNISDNADIVGSDINSQILENKN